MPQLLKLNELAARLLQFPYSKFPGVLMIYGLCRRSKAADEWNAEIDWLLSN